MSISQYNNYGFIKLEASPEILTPGGAAMGRSVSYDSAYGSIGAGSPEYYPQEAFDQGYQDYSSGQSYYETYGGTGQTPISPASSTGFSSSTVPRHVSYEQDTSQYDYIEGRGHQYTCLVSGCKQKPFNRSADLDRHYKQVHLDNSLKDQFKCDYHKCTRNQVAFHRKDHFRDHLREYHMEDLPKRGSKEKSDWLKDKSVSANWWRCTKCLRRININKQGWECPECKVHCERERQKVRSQEKKQERRSG